jgi:hypothetical protein
MKTKILTVVLALMLGGAAVFAANDTKTDSVLNKMSSINCVIYQNSNDNATLIVTKPQGENATVEIYSQNGALMGYKNLKPVEIGRVRFDLSKLPTGTYSFKVVSGKKDLYNKQISVNNSDWRNFPYPATNH